MPAVTLPAINQNVCMGWTEQQQNLYNYLPYYLVEKQVNRRKRWTTWDKFCGTIKWQPNMGDILKTVRKEPSPVIRQQAFPAALSAAATKDITDVREVSNQTSVRHHKFESPIFQFYPSFRDFMKNHVDVHSKDIMEKQEVFGDVFLRSFIFHMSPYVWIVDKANGEITSAPYGEGNDAGTTGKTTAWLQAQTPLIGQTGNLSLLTLNMAVTTLANDIGAPPFSGSNDNNNPGRAGLTDQYVLVTGAEAYNQFSFDKYLLTYKSVDLNVINNGFKGNIFGQIACKLERWPLRMLADGTFPAPEIRVVGTNNTGVATANDPYNVGESIPNPAYTSAPYEWAFLVGDQGYDSVQVGPPPKAFSGTGMPEGFGKMQWNGEIILSKNFMIPCVDANGNTVYETNAYGEYVRFISHATYGAIANQRRNILPILFKRVRGLTA